MYPLVSIIMPVYNTEKYVEQAIESVFAQTYQNIELIVIDDGSTDQSKEKIMNCFLSNCSNVSTSYYYQDNKGPSTARNSGIKKSTGMYIALLDADDLYHPEKIERQLRFLESHPKIDVIYNDIQVVDANLNKLNILQSDGNFPDQDTFLTELLFRQIIPAPAGIMLRRKCLDRVMYNKSLIYAEDYDFLIRLANDYRFGYEQGAYYICRRHSDNLTNAHHKQVESEREIIKQLGVKRIKEIVFSSAYEYEEKTIMYAKIMMKIGHYEDALQELAKIQHRTINPLVFFYLGNLKVSEQDYVQAIKYYEHALQLNRDLAEVHNNIGCCYIELGFFEMSKKYFEKALLLRSNYQDAAFNLNLAMNELVDYKLTTRELRKQLLEYQK